MSGKVFFEENPVLRKKQPHDRIHVYQCDKCGYKCKRRWNLKRHITSVHRARWTMIIEDSQTAVGSPIYKEPWEMITPGVLIKSY
jgi:hypothetical protein